MNQLFPLPTGSETTDKSYMMDLAPLEFITNEKGGQQVRKVLVDKYQIMLKLY